MYARFFAPIAMALTRYSNYHVDWTRAAERVRAGNYRYTREQFIPRAKIIAYAVAGGLVTAYFNDKEKTQCSTLALAVLATIVSGVIAHHYIADKRLSEKRKQIEAQCNKLKEEIDILLSNPSHTNFKKLVQDTLNEIKQLSQSTDTQANATQTWSYRLRLVRQVKENLICDDYQEFWQGDVNDMLIKLDPERAASSLRRATLR